MSSCIGIPGGAGVLVGGYGARGGLKVSSGKGRVVQRCSPQESADVRGIGDYVAFIDGQPGRHDHRGGHDWTAIPHLLGDASRDTSRAIARGRVSGDGRVGALPGAGAGGVVAPGARGGGCRAVSLRPTLLCLFRQGAGEVRDVARAGGRRADGERGGERARLLAGGVLSGRGGVRAIGDGGVIRRAAGTARPVAALARGVGILGGAPSRAAGGVRRAVGWRVGGGAWRQASPTHGGEGGGGSPVSSRFWPVGEPAQSDYERLRALALAAEPGDEVLAARRFDRRGLAGLISGPAAEPDYLGSLVGATRPAWCGDEDPRQQQLRDTYGFLAGGDSDSLRAVG